LVSDKEANTWHVVVAKVAAGASRRPLAAASLSRTWPRLVARVVGASTAVAVVTPAIVAVVVHTAVAADTGVAATGAVGLAGAVAVVDTVGAASVAATA
jgi:hypothetical protein